MFLAQLIVYPVKSCRGVSLPSRELEPAGLAGDRRYALSQGGAFISQRTHPRLSLVTTELSDAEILLGSPGMPPLSLPSALVKGPRACVSIWRDLVETIEHTGGSRWFSELLGEQVKLHFLEAERLRAVNRARSRPGDRVGFADGYPLLLIGQASLDALNARLEHPIPMSRFRPNLVISGGEAHAEDQLTTFRIGGVPFENAKLCDRCVVTTVDESTGRPGKEPLKTLAAYRKWEGAVWFGTNCIHRSLGRLSVGDTVDFP